MRKLLIVLLSVGLFIVAVALKQMGVHMLGAAPPPISEWAISLKAILTGTMYYLLTLLGIGAGILYEALGHANPADPIGFRQIGTYLRLPQAWRGLVVSPLIFLTVYMGVRSNPVSVPFIILAFQNGFFWKSTISRITPA